MAQRHIFCDKTEIVCMVMGKKKMQTFNLPFDSITRIQFDAYEERKLFKKVPSEKITILSGKRAEPIIYTKLKEKQFFEDYKKELEKFAQDNRITFTNNLE